MGRKPLIGTVAANVLAHGTGALNIEGARIGTEGGGTHCSSRDDAGKCKGHNNAGRSTSGETFHAAESSGGRWPANVILDENQATALDQQSGTCKSSGVYEGDGSRKPGAHSTDFGGGNRPAAMYADQGGASRFFYVAKAPKSERPVVDGVAHPTVKPLALMRWLVKLVTPPGGVVLDPFGGSGTTVEAALLEGFNVIGIEREATYLPLIQARIDRVKPITIDDRFGVNPPALFDQSVPDSGDAS